MILDGWRLAVGGWRLALAVGSWRLAVDSCVQPTSSGNGQRPTANGQRPTANGQRPTANRQLPTANCQPPNMNLILLFDDDFVAPARVRLTGRRLRHVLEVHRAAAGDELTVGVAGGRVGRGVVARLDGDVLEMDVTLDREPPAPLPLTLILALPRPKVLNRVMASVASLGVKRVVLVNAWRVEKSYWKSPRLDHLRDQLILGLEQAKDPMMPSVELRRLFRPFVEDELPAIARGPP